MSIPEQQPIDHTSEQIPALVREAVKFVPVGDFLQLRFQRGGDYSDAEETQLLDAGDVIRKFVDEKGKPYMLGGEIHPSADLRVIAARLIVPYISLEQYLAVRHEVLEASIAGTTQLRDDYASLPGWGKKMEKTNVRLMKLYADFNLTNKVIAAAKIKLSSAV